jgi:hypothetical protein
MPFLVAMVVVTLTVPVAFFKLSAPAGGKEDMGVDAGEAAESAST